MADHPATAARSPGTIQGIMLVLPVTLAVMGVGVLIPVLPGIMEQFRSVPGYAYLIQGGVLTLPSLCIALLSPLAGWLADRYGRRRILLGSMLIYAGVGIAPIFLGNLFAIIGSRFVVGACEAVVMTVSTTLICDYYHGAARDRWLATQTAVASLSSMVLIFIGGLLGSAYGWRGPFGVYLISLLLAAGVWRFTWEPAAEPADAARAAAGSQAAAAPQFPWARLLGICAITLFASVMFYTILTQCSLALTSLGVSEPARLGLLTAIASLGVPIGTFVFRALVRLPVVTLLTIEFALIGLGFVLMGKAAQPPTFVMAAWINQIGCGMILPTLLTWATRGISFEIRGRATGIWQATFAAGQFFAGIVVTYLAARSGGLLPAFGLLGLGNLAAAVLVVITVFTQRTGTTRTARQ